MVMVELGLESMGLARLAMALMILGSILQLVHLLSYISLML